jgi:hypothetical protein
VQTPVAHTKQKANRTNDSEGGTLFFLVLFLSQKKKNTFPSFPFALCAAICRPYTIDVMVGVRVN